LQASTAKFPNCSSSALTTANEVAKLTASAFLGALILVSFQSAISELQQLAKY
jgi:hypothetical protein